ncbi:MAG: hypothetical protein WBD31_17755, partial [Rubripirellula sp.]
IVVVLAAIRSHAIWMSFGFIGAPVQFEPLLLLPIGFAIVVLMLEVGAGKKTPTCAALAMFAAPLMLFGSWSPGRSSHLPFLGDLRDAFGSTGTFCMVLVAVFYGYAWLRRVPLANRAAVASLMMISGFGTVPPAAEAIGVRSWMFAMLASAIVLVMCLRTWRSDQLWLAFSGVTTVTIAMALRAYGEREAGLVVGGGFAIVSMMTIGAVFDGELAEFLRFIAGIAGVIATGGVAVWHFSTAGAGGHGSVAMVVLAIAMLVSLAYSVLVRRTGWWYVAGIQAACLAGLLAAGAYRSGSYRGANFPIQSGLACFVVGVTITSLKTGFHRRLGRLDGQEETSPLFLGGF